MAANLQRVVVGQSRVPPIVWLKKVDMRFMRARRQSMILGVCGRRVIKFGNKLYMSDLEVVSR